MSKYQCSIARYSFHKVHLQGILMQGLVDAENEEELAKKLFAGHLNSFTYEIRQDLTYIATQDVWVAEVAFYIDLSK